MCACKCCVYVLCVCVCESERVSEGLGPGRDPGGYRESGEFEKRRPSRGIIWLFQKNILARYTN